MIRCENLFFNYQETRPILKNINLDIAQGKVVALMGGSGSGKTTLLRLLAGLLKPSSGDIFLDLAQLKHPSLGHAGKNFLKNQQKLDFNQVLHLNHASQSQIYQLRQEVGMLFQFGALFTDLNVFENVAFALREHTSLKDQLIFDLVMMKLNAVGLRGCAHLMPNEISGGMAKRVALARAIALDPQIVFYDEPFAGLDPISMGVIARLIKTLNRALNMTSIVVSHDVQETFLIADEIYLLMNGEIIMHGTPDDFRNSQNPYVQQFIHAKADGPVAFHQPAKPLYLDFMMPKHY